MARFRSSGLVLATAAGPSSTTACHKSQSTGAEGSAIADGPAETPDAVPGASAGLTVAGLGLEGFGEDGELAAFRESSLSSVTLVGLARPRPRLALRPMRPASALPPLSSSGNAVIPASSRIRKSLNLSLRLFLIGRLCPFAPSPSWPSSSLLNIISGLLFIVAIDEAVFLRSPLLFGEGKGGDVAVSFGVEAFLDSQENGLVSFLVANGAGGGIWEP